MAYLKTTPTKATTAKSEEFPIYFYLTRCGVQKEQEKKRAAGAIAACHDKFGCCESFAVGTGLKIAAQIHSTCTCTGKAVHELRSSWFAVVMRK